MALFRSFSEIVNSIIERLRLTQPNLDTKPGTVARDLFIDIQADQLERLHSSILLVSEKQSPDLAVGKDLERWANNFAITKNEGSASNGIVVFTINDINTDISIPSGTIVTSNSGLQFRTIGNYLMAVAEKNRFSAIANRLRSGLDLAGITDSYAIEIPVRAVNSGTSGNISSFQIIEHNLTDAVKVTNLSSFNGGSNIESDAAFKARIFAIFSGSNTGTSFGYRNAALSVSGVNDAIVIEPGNTLMLRDGTETIQLDGGNFRILNSGTGGKVDIYILGKQLEEIIESYVYTDRSGSGNADDERNDFILGQGNLDTTLTTTERRVKAFKDGILPLQPVDSIISVVGSSSGVLSELIVDANGNSIGNYTLMKDLNIETGGSPFGFDKIHFTSNFKEVEAESIVKKSINSVDALRFSNTNNILNVYQDISIIGENSVVSSANKKIIKTKHFPLVTVNRVVNKTTGEVYVIESQNLNSETGLNNTGEIEISGKTLPSSADILSVDYVWRLYYDKFIDYNGEFNGSQFFDDNITDSIDWGTSNTITQEKSIITKTDDGLEYQIEVNQNISRVIGVYSAITTTGTITAVENTESISVPGIVLNSSDDIITNIVSIKNENKVELYNTIKSDGSFSGRVIYLPSDSPIGNTTSVTVLYNKIEMYDIENSDGVSNNNIITLPSEDILEGAEVLSDVNDLYLTGDDVYVDYVAEIINIIPSKSLINLPINGSDVNNVLFDSSLTTITGSNQPVFYSYDSSNNITGIEKFGPTRLSVTLSGLTRAGKIKINGETLTRLELEIISGVNINGLVFDLGTALKQDLNINTIPNNIGIARVDSIVSLDDADKSFDIIGQKLNTNIYGYGMVDLDESISNVQFVLPNTTNNNNLSFSSGEKLKINLLVYNTNDFEDLYFHSNGKVITDKVFARISRISVSSGFRNQAGSLIGSMIVSSNNQPNVGTTYFANYEFKAPIEGERITVRYNLNRLISDVTANLENVRSITADVLVKESPTLSVDVRGEIIINDNLINETGTIIESVSNAVVNLLNSSTLGTTVDYSDVINVVTAINGVDSVNISRFNESGNLGRKSYIKALDNQSIIAGEILFKAVSRKDFRIT